LFQRQKQKDFLHRIVTGEKWIHYDNPKRKSHGVSPAMHQYPWQSRIWLQVYVLYLVGLAGCRILRTAPSETITGNRYRLHDAFEPSIERKTAVIRAKT